MRRNPIDRPQSQVVAAASLCSGVLCATTDLRPTGSTAVDVVLLALAAAAVTWASATAPWWLLAAVALLSAAISPTVLLAVVGLVGVGIASAVGAERGNVPWARCLSTIVAIQVFARSELYGFFGLTTLISCLALAVVFGWGVLRRPRPIRRRAVRLVGLVGVLSAAAGIGFGVAALSARAPLQEGNRQARAGLAALNRGDMAAARESFDAAARSFRRADDALGAPWALGARLVPVVAQHDRSIAGLTSSAADAMAAAANAVADIDPETVRLVDGRLDLAAVQAMEPSFVRLVAAIDRLQRVVGSLESPWLVGPLQSRLASVHEEITTNQVRAENALMAVRLAPEMLGAGGVRRYFVMFTTPAEARGLGGFMGNWAELTITDGRVEMTRFGRTIDLDRVLEPRDVSLEGLDEFLGHWSQFGFGNVDGAPVGNRIWGIATMAPDFPTVAQIVSQLYPESGGSAIDGVFMLDSEAIATLLRFTGPIEVDGVGRPLTFKNAAAFINKDQYLIVENQAERIDLLDQIAQQTLDVLLTTSLPPPAELARQFAPLAAEGRLMAWSSHPEEQELFTRVKMAGAFPRLDGADGIAVTVDNANGNKIDAYLSLSVDYAAEDPDADGIVRSTATITLTNGATPTGLPDYVAGNLLGEPFGTNVTWLSVYTALPASSVEIDGVPSQMELATVFGWNVATKFVELPPGATVVVVVHLEGTLDDASLPVVTRVPAMVVPAVFRS